MKNIVLIGSTGSIGRQTLEVIGSLPDRFKVVGLGSGKNWRLMAEQIRVFRPSAVAMAGEREIMNLKELLAGSYCPELGWGRTGMESLASMPEADLVVVAVTGFAGIYPTIAAIQAGKDVALANKETLVAAGHLVMKMAERHRAAILPVDSEHSAVWQCLCGRNSGEVEKIILTASGGPFREMCLEKLEKVTVDMALKHPNWNMGSKITIDSATLMNKGLEVIEAKWLFGLNYSQIEVVIHPQSIVHSAVEFLDGSVIAQMGLPDMRLPIQYALTYPERLPGSFPKLKLASLQGLTFEEPDTRRFPCLSLAFEAGLAGGTMPAVLNAANEVAVEFFLKGLLPFLGIPSVVRSVMEKHEMASDPGLEEIIEADRWARNMGVKVIRDLFN
ncbi:1-deoxy-D-xylulose 5-phosphate reductoisomerase [Pelotomaculum thermopropionicum SI]|uniref:1-deoxy-D-xylulose 5-phosphate reductoisomerase n=1 Tax=Pelotomaculum thermopropionicum (strain DSM 13744 / JCM 10971 / SI) TaxID=370438 RepID=DXR_PELTS|nr:RecName: Full=1-deoxy-D-xylulose 5-phosphate reductoisomerase; Short=DXP reductoisomerase; AltName: Full=1-deoxyxylulose-5-phosphate reductoisomerase; AltName: Full=2-C-methyl-D-erythritol 4-phosphate synthase [Pelotomaculum thermopropionicum SI]BAF59441.1 1-deoxy-D-xylulose 5-phosphate reductoisomerase [Pelotomaculum thermopropionicum SI]